DPNFHPTTRLEVDYVGKRRLRFLCHGGIGHHCGVEPAFGHHLAAGHPLLAARHPRLAELATTTTVGIGHLVTLSSVSTRCTKDIVRVNRICRCSLLRHLDPDGGWFVGGGRLAIVGHH